MFVIFQKELDKNEKKQIDEQKTYKRCSLIFFISLLSLLLIIIMFCYQARITRDSPTFLKLIQIIFLIITFITIFPIIFFLFISLIIMPPSSYSARAGHLLIYEFLIKPLCCKKPKEHEKHKYQPYKEKKIDTNVKINKTFAIIFYTIVFFTTIIALFIKYRSNIYNKREYNVLKNLNEIVLMFDGIFCFWFLIGIIYHIFSKTDKKCLNF